MGNNNPTRSENETTQHELSGIWDKPHPLIFATGWVPAVLCHPPPPRHLSKTSETFCMVDSAVHFHIPTQYPKKEEKEKKEKNLKKKKKKKKKKKEKGKKKKKKKKS